MTNNFFEINRKDRALPFLFQTILGAINFILFIALVIFIVIYRNYLQSNHIFIFYISYGIFFLLNFLLTIIFYFKLRKNLNKDERNYFKTSPLLALFGINFFTSINFYLKSGLSKYQKSEAIKIIKTKKIVEIINDNIAKKRLKPLEATKLQTLLKIAKNQHDEWTNVSLYIFSWLDKKKIPIDFLVRDSEIIEHGKYL